MDRRDSSPIGADVEARCGAVLTGVSLDAHPTENAVIVKYEQLGSGGVTRPCQKVIQLKSLSDGVDVAALADTVLDRCGGIIPARSRPDLVQVLFYLQKRSAGAPGTAVSRASISSLTLSDSANGGAVRASMDKIEEYMELLYEEVAEKAKGVACIHELSKYNANLPTLAANETLLGALARVFREDWKRHYELATNIARTFLALSNCTDFHPPISHHKVGALMLSAVETELKRGEGWAADARGGDDKAKKCQLALKKQTVLLTVMIQLLTNLAHDLAVEWKMARRDVVPLLTRCLRPAHPSLPLQTAALEFLLKLSIVDENRAAMESSRVCERVLELLPCENGDLRGAAIRLLFNLSFHPPNTARMVNAGLVSHVAPLIQDDEAALNLLYQLSINDDAKAFIPFTDAIQIMMRDVLMGAGSAVTQAILLNACVEKRNAQLVCGGEGQGLDLLLEGALDRNDLLLMKICRNIAAHSGPTQTMFLKWMPSLLECARRLSANPIQSQADFCLECLGVAAQVTAADWTSLAKSHRLVAWLGEQLEGKGEGRQGVQLQCVVLAGTMAGQPDCARLLVPLLDTFLQLLHTLQEDDEFVVQLLYVFLGLLRHPELATRLLGDSSSSLGAYIIDLMHDKNEAIREMCEHALTIIQECSPEWARRIATERFRWHNAQWLEMVEGGGADGGVAVEEEDDYEQVYQFDDRFDDDEEESAEEPLF